MSWSRKYRRNTPVEERAKHVRSPKASEQDKKLGLAEIQKIRDMLSQKKEGKR